MVASTPPDFERFVQTHWGPALRYATRVLRREHDAEEALQEALVRAWSAWSSLDDPEAREAWFFRVLRNCCIDAYRRPSSREVPSLEVPGPALQALPEDVTLVREALARISQLLRRLPADQRRALLLREVGDLSYEEIARVTEAKRGTVMSRLFAARRRMAQLLREDGLR